MVWIFCIIMFFAIIGLAEVIHWIQLSLLRVRNHPSRVLCCILYGEFADLDLQCAVLQHKWLGEKYSDSLVALNLLEDKDMINRCRELSNTNNVLFLNPEGIKDYFKTEI